MAYYNSPSPYSSASDYGGEYNFDSYDLNYYYSQNGYEYNNYNQPYYGYYDPTPSLHFYPNFYYPSHRSYQTISYSATTPTDPKSFKYDPNYGMTQLVISYSKLEDDFNETAFDEHDPTPYGGGYDIAETYGKPLPPSDVICYPPFGSSSITDSVPVPTGAIVPLPIVDEGIDEKEIKPQNETERQLTDEMPQPQDSGENQVSVVEEVKSNVSLEESEGSEHDEDDYYSGSGGDYGNNGYSGGQSIDEYEKQVPPHYPSGYGLEAMDICESLFGYWPCLSRMKEKRGEHCCEGVRGNNCYQENMWKGTADYLFGNPNPYGGEVVYGYERHYPTQAQTQYLQIEYTADDESW